MKRILVIDDSLFVLTAVKGILEKNIRNILVDTAIVADEGKKLLLEKEYQVVLLDIIMPEISGIDILKWIRAEGKINQLKVIMLSSLEESNVLSECFRFGAYDYVSKPIDLDIFLARINHAFTEIEYIRSRQSYMEKIVIEKKAVEELNIELEKAYIDKHKSESLASIGSLAAGMAHEINNPLGFMISNLSILDTNIKSIVKAYGEIKQLIISQEEEKIHQIEDKFNMEYLMEDSPELMGDILYGTERISNVIKALRTFSSVDRTDKTDIIDMVGVVNNIIVMIQGELNEKVDITFKHEVIPKVVHNISEISLSIYNILLNACESIEKKEELKKGIVTIIVRKDEQWIHLEVEDNGCGMDKKTQEQALNPFFTTKDVQEGAGLGLTVAKNCFVNGMGGQVRIESEESVGTRIKVSLPLYEDS